MPLVARDGTALGTQVRLVVTDPAQLDPAWAVVTAELAAIDAACSRFRPDSDLSRVNAAAGRRVAVGDVFLLALDAALRAAHLTGGAVDPTIGAALVCIGYDRDFAAVAKDGSAVAMTFQRVAGWQSVSIDRRAGAVQVPAGVSLDFGATAKALAADRAADAVRSATGAGVLVSLGGDVSVAGIPPADGWAVRVTDDHAGPADAVGQTIAILSGGLATSSVTVRRWKRGGRQVHHLIDPATGQPARSPWRTVSVAGASCVDANTATTAAIVMGRSAPAWLEERGMPGRLVSRDGRVRCTSGWPASASVPA